VAGLELTRVDTNEDELAHEWVGHDLEAKRRERFGIVGFPGELLLDIVRIDALNWRNIERAGQVIDDCVQQRLNALVLEGRRARLREDVHRDDGVADTGLDLPLGGLLPRKEQQEDLSVAASVVLYP